MATLLVERALVVATTYVFCVRVLTTALYVFFRLAMRWDWVSSIVAFVAGVVYLSFCDSDLFSFDPTCDSLFTYFPHLIIFRQDCSKRCVSGCSSSLSKIKICLDCGSCDDAAALAFRTCRYVRGFFQGDRRAINFNLDMISVVFQSGLLVFGEFSSTLLVAMWMG